MALLQTCERGGLILSDIKNIPSQRVLSARGEQQTLYMAFVSLIISSWLSLILECGLALISGFGRTYGRVRWIAGQQSEI